MLPAATRFTVLKRGGAYAFVVNEESAIVPHRRPSKAPPNPEHVERRQQPRDAQTPTDWEQIVMQRMAGRIKSLTNDTSPEAQSAAGGWEDAVLRRLQRRMQELDSKK